ncbi:MAG: hypothetical protein ACRC2Y_04945 [Aeromonas veronii]
MNTVTQTTAEQAKSIRKGDLRFVYATRTVAIDPAESFDVLFASFKKNAQAIIPLVNDHILPLAESVTDEEYADGLRELADDLISFEAWVDEATITDPKFVDFFHGIHCKVQSFICQIESFHDRDFTDLGVVTEHLSMDADHLYKWFEHTERQRDTFTQDDKRQAMEALKVATVKLMDYLREQGKDTTEEARPIIKFAEFVANANTEALIADAERFDDFAFDAERDSFDVVIEGLDKVFACPVVVAGACVYGAAADLYDMA